MSESTRGFKISRGGVHQDFAGIAPAWPAGWTTCNSNGRLLSMDREIGAVGFGFAALFRIVAIWLAQRDSTS